MSYFAVLVLVAGGLCFGGVAGDDGAALTSYTPSLIGSVFDLVSEIIAAFIEIFLNIFGFSTPIELIQNLPQNIQDLVTALGGIVTDLPNLPSNFVSTLKDAASGIPGLGDLVNNLVPSIPKLPSLPTLPPLPKLPTLPPLPKLPTLPPLPSL